ncbi:hypothetical protein BU23DRAFT_650747 [Bimuria novae-zelandiae CBS 107.79]|uniref:Uncharacterized protein n=1 Tax=Bimuria novae-zelandiae CBS 107.79 TaxID=1447943 RepID=A0A6A5UXU5_9PLEO|nr:hypothetical protein BU23DRAFT_650747 [Bimuria novae-zelandiae CBS 107.79]
MLRLTPVPVLDEPLYLPDLDAWADLGFLKAFAVFKSKIAELGKIEKEWDIPIMSSGESYGHDPGAQESRLLGWFKPDRRKRKTDKLYAYMGKRNDVNLSRENNNDDGSVKYKRVMVNALLDKPLRLLPFWQNLSTQDWNTEYTRLIFSALHYLYLYLSHGLVQEFGRSDNENSLVDAVVTPSMPSSVLRAAKAPASARKVEAPTEDIPQSSLSAQDPPTSLDHLHYWFRMTTSIRAGTEWDHQPRR